MSMNPQFDHRDLYSPYGTQQISYMQQPVTMSGMQNGQMAVQTPYIQYQAVGDIRRVMYDEAQWMPYSASGLQCSPMNGVQCGPTTGVQCGPMNGVQCGPTTGVQCGPTTGVQCGPMNGVQCGPMYNVQCGPTYAVQHGQNLLIHYAVGGIQQSRMHVQTPYIQYHAVGSIQPNLMHVGTPYTQYQPNDIQHGEAPYTSNGHFGDYWGGQQFQEGRDNSKQNHGHPISISASVQQVQEDRNHLINYLNYLDVVTEDGLKDSDARMNDLTDSLIHNTNGNDPIVTTDNLATGCGSNTTFGQRTDISENEQSAPTGSISTKPKPMKGCDDRGMYVKYSNDPSSKKYPCPFCNKMVSKLPRHMEAKHSDELDVKNSMKSEKGSEERLKILESLRNIGRLNFNKDAVLNKGEMLTCRRPNLKYTNAGERFKVCPFCFGFYTKGGLRLHVNYHCKRKPNAKNSKRKPSLNVKYSKNKNTEGTSKHKITEEVLHENGEYHENTELAKHESAEETSHETPNEDSKETNPENIEEQPKQEYRGITALSTAIEARHHEKTNKALQNVFLRFRDCDLIRELKFDWLIVIYGNRLATKNTKLKSPDMVRGRLRLIARFLRELKRIEPKVTDLASMYHPDYFDTVIEAIRTTAGYNEDTRKYSTPAVASSIVTAIKAIAGLLVNQHIRNRDQEKKLLTKDFLTLMNDEVHILISKTVNENVSEMRRRKIIKLPSLDDLKLLNEYIQSESRLCYHELSKSFGLSKWLHLSKLTMISILIFNRKRVGDTENITLDDFKFKEALNGTSNQQLFEALSDNAKEIAKRYCRMRVRGKKNRTVPVLLNEFMVDCLNILISHRENVGIESKNEYLFGLPPTLIQPVRVINAGVTLKRFAQLSGAKDPSCITGTNLRKQLATTCVSLKLDDAEVADVADFMGHAELVHRNNYRQNTIDRQVVQMSQWLEAALGNVATIDKSERKTDNESLQKASKLLKKLLDALGMEDGIEDENLIRPAAATEECIAFAVESEPRRAVNPNAKKSSSKTILRQKVGRTDKKATAAKMESEPRRTACRNAKKASSL